jgi:hypothetical protein
MIKDNIVGINFIAVKIYVNEWFNEVATSNLLLHNSRVNNTNIKWLYINTHYKTLPIERYNCLIYYIIVLIQSLFERIITQPTLTFTFMFYGNIPSLLLMIPRYFELGVDRKYT